MRFTMDTLKYCDFSIICRICLTKSSITFPGDTVILNIFHKLTDLDFQTDDLPQQICLKCFETINEIHRFSFQCKRSHSAFIKCLNQQKNPEPKVQIVDVTSNDITNETENHINEDEVKEEATTNSEIFESLDKIKTEELKVDILILEPNVKEVTTKNNIIDLENEINVDSDERPYKCEKCSKTFLKKSHLIQHKRIHKDKREGGQCSKTLRPVINERIHSAKGPYKCDQCSKSYKYLTSLTKHKRGKERPFKCDKCLKAFKSNIELVQHQATHSDERSYKCDQCPKAYKHYPNLYIHKQMHSNKDPYKCDQCAITYLNKYNLKRHIKTQHKQLK